MRGAGYSGVAEAVDGMRRFMSLFRAHALHGERRMRRAACAFFADARLLAPQVAVDGIALRHLVVAEALCEVHATAIGKFTQQGEPLPLDVGGRPLVRVAKKHFVFDLQPPELSLEDS